MDLPNILRNDSFLVFNTSKVVNARINAKKETGGSIEVFLLNPVLPSKDPYISLSEQESTVWKCLVGNKKKWRVDESLKLEIPGHSGLVKISWHERDLDEVKFDWDSHKSFSEVIEGIGKLPLPPYIHKDPDAKDEERYQTVYSEESGAVAAPTAGLHFTNGILNELREKGIKKGNLVLHVGGGTFAPIKGSDPSEHPMHKEFFEVGKELLSSLIDSEQSKIIPVGTTSMRVLESLYWMGSSEEPDLEMTIDKYFPYKNHNRDIPWKLSLERILKKMESSGMDSLKAETGIFIVPGYRFRICSGLITNFHMPGTTLILLVAALLGDDWKRVYEDAIQKNYRFLSYGDSSLLIP